MKNEILQHLNQVGICVLEEYYPKEYCDIAIKDIEDGLKKYSNKVLNEKKEGTSGDFRLFKMENHYSTAKNFSTDKDLLEIASLYKNYPMISHFVLGGKLESIENEIRNSGAGWHKDSGHETQIKTIVYLSDVDETNGPFMFLPIPKQTQIPTRDGNPNYTRYSDLEIDNFIKNNNISPFVVTGKKGTVIFADTSYIHRGANIKEGKRYTYTNYYFENHPQRISLSEQTWGKYYI
tara:strand:+ start:396 stop:1100 length:705 start_codon:yes stop_codon:yes gene_type:complete